MCKSTKLKFYSDLSPLKKAWNALWERPKGNQKDAIELNKELIERIIQIENENVALDKLNDMSEIKRRVLAESLPIIEEEEYEKENKKSN